MRTLKLLFVNSSAQVIGKLISSLATILISAIIGRSLGTGGFGEFTIMTTYAGLFYTLTDFGFNALILRQASGDEGRIRDDFQKLLGLRIVYATLLIFIALAVLNFFPYSATLKLAIIVTCLTILTQAVVNSANLIFQFRLRYDLSVIATSFGVILNLVLIYLLAHLNLSILLIALSYVVSGVATAVIALSLVRNLLPSVRARFDVSWWMKSSILALPIGLTLFFNLIYFHADALILSIEKGTTDVGIYGAAYKIFESAITLPTFFMNALYPMLISAYEKDRNKFQRLIRYSFIGLISISVVGAIVGIVVAPQLLTLIYGSKFSDSVLPFRILIASAPLFYLSSLYMWLLILLKKQKVMALVYSSGMLLNIALNLFFIPQFSYTAAAIITGVSEAFILVLTFYLSRGWHENNLT